MESNKIYLTSNEFKNIIGNEIGHGTDGIVYKYNKDYLLKVYRNNFFKKPDEIIQAETKVYDPNNKPKFVPIKENIKFYINEGNQRMRLNNEWAMNEIINKQRKVIKTELPKKLVYVDGKFVGILLKKVSGIQIHKFTGAPFQYKKKVTLAVIDAVKELLDNNIYHEDLANSPYARTVYTQGDESNHSFGHSHVLLNPFTMKVNIIDLDGKSTVYTDYLDKLEEEKTLINLSQLILEFLYKVDEEEHAYEEDSPIQQDIQTIIDKLNKHGIELETAERIAEKGFASIDEAYDVVRKSK